MSARHARLNRQRVAAKALELLDRDGLERFNMRRLGAELGVEAMALYRHFPSKAALIDAAVAVVLAELGPPSAEGVWQDRLMRAGRSLREAALRHPNVFPILATMGSESPAVAPYLGVAADALERAGFDADRRLDALRVLFGYVIGFALWDVKARRLEDRSFEFGLRAVVRGLEAMLAEPRG